MKKTATHVSFFILGAAAMIAGSAFAAFQTATKNNPGGVVAPAPKTTAPEKGAQVSVVQEPIRTMQTVEKEIRKELDTQPAKSDADRIRELEVQVRLLDARLNKLEAQEVYQ